MNVKSNQLRTAFLSMSALLFSACGGDGENSGGILNDPDFTVEKRSGLTVIYPAEQPLRDLSSPWLVVADLFQIAAKPNTTGEVSVKAIAYTDFGFLNHVDFYTRELDQCSIQTSGTGGGGSDIDRRVNAGNSIELTSAGGTWVSVPYSETEKRYFGDRVFPGALPADLGVSIPGNDFPFVDNWQLNVPPSPVRVSPAVGEFVSPDTEYRWNPSNNISYMVITFMRFVEGQFRGFPVTCVAVDDGVFTLTGEALDFVTQLPGELLVRYESVNRVVEYRNGVAFFQNVVVADTD